MVKVSPVSRCVLLSVLLALSGCSKRTTPADPKEAGASASADSGAPRNTIAPLIMPADLPHVDVVATEDFHWATETEATVGLDETFLVEIGMGGGRDGLNVTTVAANGHASHVYRTRTKDGIGWVRVAFTVERPELERLAKVLNENRFLQLPQRYEAKDLHDGAQWILHVRSGGLDKYVYADNAFPDPLLAVARFVTTQLVDTRPALYGESKPARLGSDYGDHLWRAARRYAVRELEPEPPSFEDAPRVIGLVLPDDPLAEGTLLEATIVDQSNADKVLGSVDSPAPRFSLFYNEGKVDPQHHYALLVKLLAGKRVLAESGSLPVITYDGAFALDVLLRPSAPSPAASAPR
jgi:hypothetical protein